MSNLKLTAGQLGRWTTDAGHTVTVGGGGPCGDHVTVRLGGEWVSLQRSDLIRECGSPFDGGRYYPPSSILRAAVAHFDAGERGSAEGARLTAEFRRANPVIPMERGGLAALIAADRPS